MTQNPTTEALLDRIREETLQAVIEGDAQDCSSPDCIADAVYEIVRVALRDEARATAPAGLDVPLLTRSLAVVRARGEAFALSGQHVHWTDAEVAAMVADVYAELAALAASGETEQDR